ncbi:hypothetical protein AAG906_011119 [Vitis piasezkii]
MSRQRHVWKDDHFAWKHSVSSEASIDTFGLDPASWIRVRGGYSWPLPEDRWAVGLPGLASGWHTIEVAPPLVTLPIPTSEDPHARMDRLE